MTGTASFFTDNTGSESRNINLLTTWLFGRVNTDCILTDISECSGAALIPKNQPVPAEFFELVVMSPDNNDVALLVLKAERRWVDNDFSIKHKKIGIKFLQHEKVDEDSLNIIKDFFMLDINIDIKCSFLNM